MSTAQASSTASTLAATGRSTSWTAFSSGLTQADLANGGSVALSLVGQISPRPQGPTGGSLVVGCDNLGYMARNDFIPDYPFTQISLFKFDVTTAQVIAVQEFTPGQYINNLGTCLP